MDVDHCAFSQIHETNMRAWTCSIAMEDTLCCQQEKHSILQTWKYGAWGDILDSLVGKIVLNLVNVAQSLDVGRIRIDLLNITLLVLNRFSLFCPINKLLCIPSKQKCLLISIEITIFLLLEFCLEHSKGCIHVWMQHAVLQFQMIKCCLCFSWNNPFLRIFVGTTRK